MCIYVYTYGGSVFARLTSWVIVCFVEWVLKVLSRMKLHSPFMMGHEQLPE